MKVILNIYLSIQDQELAKYDSIFYLPCLRRACCAVAVVTLNIFVNPILVLSCMDS